MTSNYEFLSKICFKMDESIRMDKKLERKIDPYDFKFKNNIYRIFTRQDIFYLCKFPFTISGTIQLADLTPECLSYAMNLLLIDEIHNL